MDGKAKAILQDLMKSFGETEITYEFGNELHKFRIEGTPPHWVYVARNFIDDHTVPELLARLARDRVVDELKKSEKSRWLFLAGNELREVDADFGRGYVL